MPFYEPQSVTRDLTNLAPPDDAPEYTPSTVEVLGAALRTQNTVASWAASRSGVDPYVIEPGFDAIDYVKDDPEFSPYVEEFAGLFNRRAADAKKMQIRREIQDRRIVDAGGVTGVLGSMAAGIVDLPTFLIPGGIAASAARTTGSMALGIAAGAALDAGVSEAALQATQVDRTAEETAVNIGGSIVLGGALGALVGRYMRAGEAKALSDKIDRQEAEFEAVDGFLSGGAQSAGAAARDRGPLALKDEDIIKRLPIMNRQDPLIRMQLSELDTAREYVRGLAETPLEYADNVRGVATERGGSVESRMKLWNAPLYQSLREMDTLYARYYHGTPEPTSWQRRLSPMLSEFDRIRGNSNRLTWREFKEQVSRAAFSGEQHAIPEVAQAARAYRQMDDQMKKAAIEAGLLPEDVAVKGDVSHLFRMYNREKIIAERNQFARILQDYFTTKRDEAARIADLEARAANLDAAARRQQEKLDEFSRLSDAELRGIVDETIDTILGNAEGRIPYDSIVSGPRGPLKERLLNIESAKIAEFMELDIEQVMRAQMRTMSADVEISKKFGSPDMAEQIRQINDEANRKIAQATTPAQRRKLETARKNAVRDLEGIRDRLRGQYALPSNPDSLVVRANRMVRNLNYMRLLGGMTISAIPDMAKVVFTHGLTRTFRDGFMPMIRNFKAYRGAAEEIKTSGTALDMMLDSRTMALADVADDFGRHSRLERGIQAMSSRFGLVSLMAPWNAALKQFSGIVTMTNLLRASQKLAKGTATKDEIRRLASSGIDADMARRIADQFAQHGEVTDGVFLAQTINWTDRQAIDAVRTAIVRDVDRIIVTPGQDKPLWMSTELGKTIGQFKSFPISSTQRTMLAGLQQRDAATLNGVLLMLSLGALTYALKEKVAGRELSDKPSVWAQNALDWSGLAGWLMEANNIAEKATRGRVGFSALTGEQVTRYSSRNVTGAFLGPTADAVSDIFQVSGSIFAGDTTKSDLRKMRQLLPMQNLFYIRGLLNEIEEATGEALGLPDTAQR
jgi:hypothetical protein